MRMHVLTGCSELLQPRILTAEEAQSLIGPRVRTASASWLGACTEGTYHAALQEQPGDNRTSVMAQALNEEFGGRFEPLLVLPKLLDEAESGGNGSPPTPPAAGKRSQVTVLCEIGTHGHPGEIRLYGLGLPDDVDPEQSWAVPAGIVASKVHARIDKLSGNGIAQAATGAVDVRVIEATPDLPAFPILYTNAICNQLAQRLLPRFHALGWAADEGVLSKAIAVVVKDWDKKGLAPGLSLRAGDLDAMADLVFKKLL